MAIAFEFGFALDVRGVGARLIQFEPANGAPGLRLFDAGDSELLAFGAEPDGEFFMGGLNTSPADPAFASATWTHTQFPTTEVYRLDDLVIRFAPEPGAAGLVAAGLAMIVGGRLRRVGPGH